MSYWFPDGLDGDYLQRLIELGRSAGKVPWSCSMYHQEAVAGILMREGITEQMTMEETQAFCAKEAPCA